MTHKEKSILFAANRAVEQSGLTDCLNAPEYRIDPDLSWLLGFMPDNKPKPTTQATLNGVPLVFEKEVA